MNGQTTWSRFKPTEPAMEDPHQIQQGKLAGVQDWRKNDKLTCSSIFLASVKWDFCVKQQVPGKKSEIRLLNRHVDDMNAWKIKCDPIFIPNTWQHMLNEIGA